MLEMIGGPDRDRTDDLFHAMEARSQLRHRPTLGVGLLYSPGCAPASQTKTPEPDPASHPQTPESPAVRPWRWIGCWYMPSWPSTMHS